MNLDKKMDYKKYPVMISLSPLTWSSAGSLHRQSLQNLLDLWGEETSQRPFPWKYCKHLFSFKGSLIQKIQENEYIVYQKEEYDISARRTWYVRKRNIIYMKEEYDISERRIWYIRKMNMIYQKEEYDISERRIWYIRKNNMIY